MKGNLHGRPRGPGFGLSIAYRESTRVPSRSTYILDLCFANWLNKRNLICGLNLG
jgi:hypothetical protein